MKKLSLWAKNNKWPSRIILAFGILLINAAGIVTGLLLKDLGIIIPSAFFLLLVLIYFTAIILYPAKSQKRKLGFNRFYYRQKTCDSLLAATAFCMFICISNDKTPFKTYFSILQSVSASTPLPIADSSLKNYKSLPVFSKSLKGEDGKLLNWKERKKLLKAQVKAIKQSTDMSKGGKTALIILSVLLAIGLIFLVASLACNLSCNGMDGAAVLVGIGGTALVVFLLILVIRSINGKKKKKNIPKEPDPGI